MFPFAGWGAGVTKICNRADNIADGLRLKKSLASSEQISEVGRTIAGQGSNVPFRDAPRIVSEYGGNANDWVKKSSSNYISPQGQGHPNMQLFETHWVENVTTGKRIEFKTKFPQVP